MSGVGKTTLARQLAKEWGKASVVVSTTGVNLGAEDLLLEIATEFEESGATAMAEADSFESGMVDALSEGSLIAITNFDEALDSRTRLPHKSVMELLSRISRLNTSGRMLLVCSQRVCEGEWSREIDFRYLGAPEQHEAVVYLGDLLQRRGLEAELPEEKRVDVVRWLAHNPRAIHTLVICLQEEPLESLIELEPEAWALRDEVVSPELLRRLEEAFMAQTIKRMDANAQLFVGQLSVYRRPFQADAMSRLAPLVADVNAGRNSLSNRFLLGQSSPGWFIIHPVVRYLARSRLVDNPRLLNIAHGYAADHYTRHFKAAGGLPRRLTAVGNSFVEARFHLVKSGREVEFDDIASRYRQQLSSHYKNVTRLPNDEAEARTLLVVLSAALSHDDAGFDRLRTLLARLLVKRNNPGDQNLALRQVTIATRATKDFRAWRLRLELSWALEGVASAQVVARQAVGQVPLSEVWKIFHFHASRLFEANKSADALIFLEEGFTKSHPNNLFGLYSLAGFILTSTGRRRDAIELLMSAYTMLGPDGYHRSRLFEQAVFIAYARQDVVGIRKVISAVSADGHPSQVALCAALILSCEGRYQEAADLVAATEMSPAMAGQAAFLRLCVHNVKGAAEIIATERLASNPATSWIRALVALCEGKDEVYNQELQLMMGRPLMDEERQSTNLWLRFWADDPSVQKIFPAFYYPKLPRVLTGLSFDLMHHRVQHGEIDEELCSSICLPRGEHSSVPLEETPKLVVEYMEVNMEGNKSWNITGSQIGVAGDHAKVDKVEFAQLGSGDDVDLDPSKLSAELKQLLQSMKAAANLPEEYDSVAEVARAEAAAESGDSSTAVGHLVKSGKWAFTVATSIGATLAAAVLKAHLGL
ncbi:Rab family GTPase [Amycolatopsis stemonae]